MTRRSLTRTALWLLGLLLVPSIGLCGPVDDPHAQAIAAAPTPDEPARDGPVAAPEQHPEAAVAAPAEAALPPESQGPVGHLRVFVNVPSHVALNGSAVGMAGPNEPLSLTDLAANRYLFTASAPGYEARKGEVYISEGEWNQQVVWLFAETEAADAPESGDPGLGEAPGPYRAATLPGPADRAANIVMGRCRMDYCWWWRIEQSETIGTKDRATLIKLDVTTTGISYRLARGRDDDSRYPDYPPPGAIWPTDTTPVYVLCSMTLPALFSHRDEDERLVGHILFAPDGFSWGAAEGAANLWRFACGIAADEALTFDALPEPSHGEILIDAAEQILDLL